LFTTGADTLAALKQHVPRVLLLDINLPDYNGINLSKELRELYPDLLIIILSVHNEKAVIGSVLNNKVNGYLLKNSAGTEIIEDVDRVVGGDTFLWRESREIIGDTADAGPAGVPVISRREKEVLALVAEGYTSTQIADKLFISNHTVEWHRKNRMEKFVAGNRPVLIKLAIGTTPIKP